MGKAIVAAGVSKSYLINHEQPARATTFREAVTEGVGSLWRQLADPRTAVEARTPRTEEFWALRDVSFEVEQGERIGIIGANGAGKSTLLKILSRITEPTHGRVTIKGRVSSLLEVGTGFHAELTGRENIHLNGAILGMSRPEIRRKFDEIVAFAEVDQFLDTPVKRYSSGMYVRLAFAVAAHLDPEVLIVDEVLAVGDARFQKKSLGKMEAAAKGGTTVVFVSHGMGAVKNLCHTAIVMEKGRASAKTSVEEAINSYLSFVEPQSEIRYPLVGKDVEIHSFLVLQDNMIHEQYDSGKPIKVQIKFRVLGDQTLFRIGFLVRSRYGDMLLRSLLADWDGSYENMAAGDYVVRGEIPANTFVSGEFVIQVDCSRFGLVDYGFWEPSATLLKVSAPKTYNPAHPDERPFGVFNINADWRLERIDLGGSKGSL